MKHPIHHLFKPIKFLFPVLLLTFFTQTSFAQTLDDLMKAISAGDEEKALSIIPAVNVNTLDKDGNTPLVAAATFYPKITKALVDAKADPNLLTKPGTSALFNACRWGNAEAVKILIDAGADVNKETLLGPALLGTFYFSSAPIVKMMLDAGARFKEPVKLMNTLQVYPILHYIKTVKTPAEMVAYYAASREAWLKLPVKFPDRVLNPKESEFSPASEVIKLFIEKGLDVNQVYESNKVKETALDVAMQNGLAEAAKVLLDAGAQYDASKEIAIKDRTNNVNALFPNLTFTNGDYVLGAVLSNKIDLVKLMVGRNPKMIAKKYTGKGFVRCYADNNIPKDQTYEVEDIDMLMVAAEHGNPEIVKFLIEQGAGKGTIAKAKWTGIHDRKLLCVFLTVRWTMSFAKNSKNQEIIDLVKKAGHTKE